MRWEDLPETIDKWAMKTASPADALRREVVNVITSSHIGYYYNPVSEKVAVFAPMAIPADRARVKAAMCRAVGHDNVALSFSYQQLIDPGETWVKVAYSPTLRRAGELLNFFPGQYPGGVPNTPSPVASMLTSGLVGAGLGWGGGKLVGSMLPGQTGKKLSRTGMILGGLLGATPGAVWGGTNKLIGRDFNDPAVLNQHAGAEPDNFSEGVTPGSPQILEDVAEHVRNSPVSRMKIGLDLSGVELCEMYKIAMEKVADTFGSPAEHYGHLPTDVNINTLGQTLWETGASPSLAATTMAGMYAAHQMPDPHSRPGIVTGRQLGELAANTVGDYAKGYLVGAVINNAIGTPFRNSSFGAGNAVLGILGAVVPKLFGG